MNLMAGGVGVLLYTRKEVSRPYALTSDNDKSKGRPAKERYAIDTVAVIVPVRRYVLIKSEHAEFD